MPHTAQCTCLLGVAEDVTEDTVGAAVDVTTGTVGAAVDVGTGTVGTGTGTVDASTVGAADALETAEGTAGGKGALGTLAAATGL